MPAQGNAPFRKINSEAGPYITWGNKATRAAIANDNPSAPIGTIYISTTATSGGAIFVRYRNQANGVQATDWRSVTTGANDTGA